jgi:Mg-chelatase subunit ChlD
MKMCEACGASNNHFSNFCFACGQALTETEQAGRLADSRPLATREPPRKHSAQELAAALAAQASQLENKRRADIMFVLDCTGSMSGELNAIRDAITDFADTIRTEGVRARVGLIEFRDRLSGEEHRALSFAGQPFTDDPDLFRREVSHLIADGGDDNPESSLDALMLALRQPFAAGAAKVIVLVTDDEPHLPDKETRSIAEVIAALRRVGIHQLYLVIRTEEEYSHLYLQLLEATRGLAFELGEGDDFATRAKDFQRILMGLGRTISQETR